MPPLNQAPQWANREPLRRTFNLERAAINVEKRTAHLSFSSETTEVVRWGDVEILDHSPGAVDLTQLNEIGVTLFNHDLNQVIGGVDRAEIVNRRGEADVHFDADEPSDIIFQKVANGTLKAVSCRYNVSNWEYVPAGEVSLDGRFNGPCYIARKWKPTELSIVSIPADASVGVGRSAEPGDSRSDKNEQRSDPEMPPINTPATPAAAPVPAAAPEPTRAAVPATPAAPAEPDTTAIRAEAAKAERQRVSEITSLCRAFEMDPQGYIDNGTSVEAVRKAILDAEAQRRAPLNTAQQVDVQREESAKVRAAMIDGLSMRASLAVEKPAAGAADFRGYTLLRLAEECVERSTGQRKRYSNPEDLIREALTGASQFPGILSNVANKSMSTAYQVAPTTFQAWTGKGSVNDFKVGTRYRLSEADELLPITSQGEFKSAEVTEGSATVSIGTFGRKFSITRQAIINDDMGALSTIPAKYGAAARRMINRLVYKVLKDNPVIEGAALFHADHKNLAAVAAALSVASLGKAKAAMLKQKNIGAQEYLNIQPAFLLVPTDLEVTATQLISSIVDPSKANATPNPFANKMSVISDPYIDEISATCWFLAAAAGMAETIEVTYLQGREQPTMESQVSFDVLGIVWRIYFDFGVNLLDFRGMYKNAGQ